LDHRAERLGLRLCQDSRSLAVSRSAEKMALCDWASARSSRSDASRSEITNSMCSFICRSRMTAQPGWPTAPSVRRRSSEEGRKWTASRVICASRRG
jgi:hypothetical protein